MKNSFRSCRIRSRIGFASKTSIHPTTTALPLQDMMFLWRSTFRAFRKNPVAMILVCIVLAILAFTFIQPYLPNQLDSFNSNINPQTGAIFRNLEPGSKVVLEDGRDFTFIMGTNELGQDLWSRLWGATRTSLLIGVAVACIEAIIGIAAGVLWGYVRQTDIVFTELYNILDNVPSSLVLILVSYMMKPSVGSTNVRFVIAN